MTINPIGVVNTTEKNAYPSLLKAAREMRKNPTPAEIRIWSLLRGKRLGVKFRRQHIIGPFIVDFFCVELSLVVEIDGEAHDEQKKKDRARHMALESLGCSVLRFSNDEALFEYKTVLAKLMNQISSLKSPL